MNKCKLCGKDIPDGRSYCSIKCSIKDSSAKGNRTEILALHKQGMLGADIARQLGISRARVAQVRAEAGLKPNKPSRRFGFSETCLRCGKKIGVRTNSSFCGMECYQAMVDENRIEVQCEWCGKKLARKPSVAKRNTIHFCDYECHGKWLATTAGFTARPENRRNKWSTYKCPECNAHARIYFKSKERIRLKCDNGHLAWAVAEQPAIIIEGPAMSNEH
jgi:hypothetical protein